MAHQPSDSERIGVLIAEAECRAIETVFAHTDASELAQWRVARALSTIREALDVRRDELGISTASTHWQAHG